MFSAKSELKNSILDKNGYLYICIVYLYLERQIIKKIGELI